MAKTATKYAPTPQAPNPAPSAPKAQATPVTVTGPELGGGGGTKPVGSSSIATPGLGTTPANRVTPPVAPPPPAQTVLTLSNRGGTPLRFVQSADPYGGGNTWFHAPDSPGTYFVVDGAGNFVAGDSGGADYYGGYRAGNVPGAGNYEDATSQADKATANSNYGAGMADIQAQKNDLNTNFQEALKAIDKSKGKSLSSLAETSADRGMTNSGIFLKSTGDTNEKFQGDIDNTSRSHTQALTGYERQGTNLSDALGKALRDADTAAYQRALTAWTNKRDEAIKQATARLAAVQQGTG